MALTIRPVRSFVVGGGRRENVFDITFDNSYRTGGLALTPAQLGFYQLEWANALTARTGQTFHYDAASSRLMAFAGGTQVADATDLSAVVTRLVTRGKGRAVA